MKKKGCGTAKVIDKEDLCAMATAGLTPAQIANYFGLSRQGFNYIIEKNEELKDAFHNGLHHVLVRCVRVLMNKLDQGDTFAAIYLLNNRFGWVEEKYRKEKEVLDMPTVQIYLPENGRDLVKNEKMIEAE